MFIEEEKVRYHKKKDSDISKANKKSKHKHIYDKKVVFEYQGNGALDSIWHIGVCYCSICGKIGDQIKTSFLQNYKKAKETVIDEYESWQEELEEREKELDKREEELGVK